MEEMQSGDFQKRNETNEIYIPPGPPGRQGHRVPPTAKAFDDKSLYENLSSSVPKERHRRHSVGAHRAPASRRCSS
ncbi:hypothetical protein DSL92_01185 [Billgrantia gudaonensis]|uniref:Uncharacterized protein n=1 Tax=Billgrantia gudaonensis TaxID=376427 RepID=A0A3S0NXE5_9GAMM|nr:hypothetical protein DSL92_01185 [Halomonas gudaonensis]